MFSTWRHPKIKENLKLKMTSIIWWLKWKASYYGRWPKSQYGSLFGSTLHHLCTIFSFYNTSLLIISDIIKLSAAIVQCWQSFWLDFSPDTSPDTHTRDQKTTHIILFFFNFGLNNEPNIWERLKITKFILIMFLGKVISYMYFLCVKIQE